MIGDLEVRAGLVGLSGQPPSWVGLSSELRQRFDVIAVASQEKPGTCLH